MNFKKVSNWFTVFSIYWLIRGGDLAVGESFVVLRQVEPPQSTTAVALSSQMLKIFC